MCCANFGVDPATYQCAPSGLLACTGSSKVACDDTTDCGSGQVCCATQDQLTGVFSVECRFQCKPFSGNQKVAVLCDPNAAVDQCAPFNRTCQPSSSLPGYNICKG